MKNVKGKILGRKVLSFILTATLVLGLMPGNILTVSAEGTDTIISDELIVESVSSNDAFATTECTCGTDEPAFHATNCPAYIAPENPKCTCAEKCTEDTLNVWCDVCGVQGVSACQGEDTAVAYEIVANGTCGAQGNESSVTWSLDSDGTLTISGTGAMADYELVLEWPYHYTTPWHDTDNDGEYQNSNIKKVVVEEGVTHIGNSAFKDFTELTSISIPNTVKSIGNGSVSYCRKLESLVIPDSVTSIGKEAFDDNRMLTSVTIGNRVESIGEFAFSSVGWDADKNFTITLPKSVTSIDSRAFSNIYRGATIRYSCSYNEGNGYSTKYTNATLEQYHLCEYSSSGNKINCSGCTCGEYSSSTATLSLSSDEPIYYTGEEIKPAVTVTYPDDWGGDKIEPNESNCTYSYNINAGTATCTFKYAEGVEASLDFTIQKATPTEEMFTHIESAVYDGNEKSANVVANQDITGMGEITIKYYQNDIEVTPVNVGTYTVKIDVAEGDNCTDIVGLEIGTFEITKATPTADIFTYTSSAVYDGTAKSANVVEKDGITGIGAITNIKYYQNGEATTPVNAGEYTVKIDVAEGDNYVAATDIEVGTFEITKATPTADMFTYTAPTNLDYDGQQKSATVTTNKEGMGDITVRYIGDPVAAGTYTVFIDVEASTNYNAVLNLLVGEFTINKTDSVITAAPTPIADLVYGGTAYYLINAGTATGGTMLYSLEEDGEYSTNIPQGLNAGDYTIWYKVDGDENHNDTTPASIEVTIAPKTLEISSVTAINRKFDGTNIVEVSEVIISGILNTDNVSVSATATINSINVGEYSTVDLAGITLTGDDASNYSIAASAEDVDLVPIVTISKAAAPTLSRGSKAYVYNQSYEGEFVSITGVPTDCGEVEYVLLSVSGNMLENISVDRSSGKITYDVKALDSYTEDLQGTIDVDVEMENYETAFYKLTITRRDKYAVTVKDGMSVSLETNELIYGQRLGELAFNEVTFVGEAGEEVTGTLRWENPSEVPGVATDKASWRFIPDSDVYKEVVGTLDITVKQAPLEVEAVPVVADRVYNPSVTLADVALSGGTVKDEYGHTIEGTWSWEDSDTVPTVGNAGYEAVFTPADANYETVTGTITVTVAKATPDIGTVSVLDDELENTTDISMVVLKRTDESMAGTLELTAEALLYGAHGYVWKFTPQDLNNYEVLTGTVAIEVKDTIAPVASYRIGTGDWESFGTSTTYETFSKEELSVEIKAEDSGSGIASVQYYVAPEEIPDVSYIPGWTDYTEAITLDIDRTHVIYVKVTDNGGNEVILNSEGIVVYAESVIAPTSISCEYGEENSLDVDISTNGNTFAKLTDGSGNEIDAEKYSIDGSTLTIKGEYLSDLDVGEYTYKICMNPQGVETTAVTLAYSFVVNVTAKELTVTGATAASRAYIANDYTVDITGITLSGIQGTDDVSVSLTSVKGTLSSANAGTYTSLTLPALTLTGADKGNYELVQPTGPVTVLVGIEKLNAEIIVEESEHGKIFGQPPFSLGVSDNNPEAEVTYESDNEDVATVTSEGIVTIHKAGSAQITVFLAESTNYISADSKQIIVDVAKEDGYTVATIQRNYLYSRENADTIDLSAYLPADCGEVTYGTPAVMEGRIFSVAPTMNGSVLGYSVAAGEVSDAAQITVTVKSDNYADFTITVVPELVDQLPVSPKTEVTLTNDTITYGDALSEMSFEEVVFEDEAGNAVAGTLAWKEAALKPEAGTTNATWVFTPDNEEYAVKEGSVAIVVNKAVATVVTAPAAREGLTYTGEEENLVSGGATSDGTIEYSLDGTTWNSNIPSATKADTYTVWYKVVGDKNHNDTTPASIEVTIAPKTLEIGCVTASDRVFDGTNKVEVSEVIISGILNTDNVSASATATINSINAGVYSTVDLAGITLTGDAASNYSIVASAENVSLTIPVTISKAAAPTLPRGSKEYVYNQSYEGEFVSITGLPTDCGEVTYSLQSMSGDMLEIVSIDANGKITYDVKALDSYTEDLARTIIRVEMDNYENAFYTLDVTRRDKYEVTVKDGMSVSLETNELIYGQRLGELAFNGVTFVGEAGEVVDGILMWEDSNKVPDVATDKASWRFIPDIDAYKEVVGTLDITVKRAPLEVEAVPVVTDRTYDPSVTLESVVLSGGTVKDAYGNTIEGTWSWEDSDIVPTVGNAGYEAVFTPVDINYYETVTETIRVKVNQATPVIAQVNGTTITYGDSLAASTVSGQAKHSASVDMAVAGSFAWKDTTVKPAVADSDTTAFEVVFTPADSVNYKAVETTAKITVNKAPAAPNKPESSLNVPYTTGTVGETDLPAGWTWQNGETALEVGVVCNAVAVYTGTDAGNYETESVTVAITRAACVHDGETELRGSVEESCTEAGYTGDTYCLICEEKLATGEAIPATGHKDADKNHVCDNGCNVAQGTCEDADKDHDCDYGCDKVYGTCEDVDKDHDCDYGCDKVFGTCEDTDKDHACDYGCDKVYGTCEDVDKDHDCDYGCDKVFGTCEDTDKDHACDYGCDKAFGTCEDTNKDHDCDYGCDKVYGTCEDVDKDHDCDYGCDKVFGTCEDTDKDHDCDYGCDKVFGTCEDADKDHDCDYGCDKAFGTCEDTDKDHDCDYGCDKAFGTCEDTDKDHACDYGCDKAFGTCVDTDKDHDCDYGCDKVYGTCEDVDKDHDCDYGCDKVFGTCGDTDKDHDCDYGCDKAFGTCTDAEKDGDHSCDYGCGKALTTCSGGTATCATKATCEECGKEYGSVDINNHTGKILVLDAVAANCIEEGYTGDTYCKDCGLKLQAGQKIPTTEHTDEDKNQICDDCQADLSTPSAPTFVDVKENQWYYSYVNYVVMKGILSGKKVNEDGSIYFDPDNTMTRAEFAQVLYNAEGKPAVEYAEKFVDVKNGKWYTNAIIWASEKGIVTGYGNGSFGVSDPITREQMVTMLYKYAQYKGYEISGDCELGTYSDSTSISSWAVKYMKWAVANSVMKGKKEKLDPIGNATRAECATMLKNFMDRYEK